MAEFEKSHPLFSYTQPSLSLPLPPLLSDKEEGSVVMFGGVDKKYYKGDLKWVPLSQPHYWQITLDR